MYHYRKRTEWLGRQIYQRKGWTDKQLSVFGTIVGIVLILLVLVMGGMAIYYTIKNGGL